MLTLRRSALWQRAALAAAWLFVSGLARADLDSETRALVGSFASSGSVRRLPPRFVERGGLRPLLLPSDWLDPLREDCVTVVVLGSPSTTFLLRFLPTRNALIWPDGEHPEISVAGAAQLVRCGVRKAMLGRLAMEMRSPRGAVEVVLARGERPFPPLTRALASRAPGALAAPGIAGPRARTGLLENRVQAQVLRARRDGATAVQRRDVAADASGRGRVGVALEPGCHRLTVLGADAADGNVDVDADLALGASAEPVASDRTEAPDAALHSCVGERSVGTLSFQGAAPARGVTLLVERRPLPAAVPARWAPIERARLADALRKERVPAELAAPVAAARGVTGVTVIPLELEPDGCYVAAVAAVRGESAGVALSVELGARQAQNHGGAGALGTALAFCAGGDAAVRVNVEVAGQAVAWVFALFPSGRVPNGEQAE